MNDLYFTLKRKKACRFNHFRRKCISSAIYCGRSLVKYSAYAECEIIHFLNCEISPFGRCEMKFASSHLRSKYFTAELFHMAKPYFTRRRRISLKKAHIVLVDKCVLFSGAGNSLTNPALRRNYFCDVVHLSRKAIRFLRIGEGSASIYFGNRT